MVAASDLVPNLARITGLPLSTVIGVKRRLVETGIWPSSRGATVPKLNTRHTVMMLLALLTDVPAKDAASAACAYYALMDPTGRNGLGDVLVNMINSFKSASDTAALAYKSRIEVDCDRPRACLSIETIEGQCETLFGIQSAPWSDIRVRRSMTISGKCLFDLACGLHFNRWESA
ncbi:hypothetical protein V1290_004416 [Bradyrhizobium sp. AZCC 1578]|uniref:hypothetical protein n=1 Tax=Bradyrhizobium sp. AZCC 1578 TaxID=3117027 RepID=UPI002FF11A30